MLARRLISAAIGVPLLLVVLVERGNLFDAVLALVLAAATVEFLLQAGVPPRRPELWLAGLSSAAFGLLRPAHAGLLAGILTGILLLSLLSLAAQRLQDANNIHWALCVALTLYIGWLGSYLGLLRHTADGRDWILFAILVTFASDTGAYVIGRLLGRHMLAPRISPAKTVEGALGGLLVAAFAALLLDLVLDLRISRLLVLGFGSIVSIAAQLGDLAESALKRRLQIKDAGWLVPGHGGLLDRLDSLLFSGVVVYCVVQWLSL